MADDLNRYFKSRIKEEHRHDRREGVNSNLPYWILLPMWLAEHIRVHENRCRWNRDFLGDVLWAQYCLFQQVRIHDDLLDGQESNLALIFAANQFLFEAQCVLLKHFSRSSPFWKIYMHCVEQTNRAILEVKASQSGRMVDPRKILTLHKNVCSIFKVGSAAICMKAGKRTMYPPLEVYLDEMAKISQAIDDFRDIEEDLRRGELNYTASYILRSNGNTLPAKSVALKSIVKKLLESNVMTLYFRELRVHLKQAHAALLPFKFQQALEHWSQMEAQLASLEESLHRRRVQLIFGKLVRL